MPSDPQQQSLRDRLPRLNEISVALSAEDDLNVLLERILQQAREFTRADAGTLYLVRNGALNFEITQNDTLRHAGEGRWEKADMPPLAIDRKSASGYVAVTGEVLNIADVYAEREHCGVS